MLLIFQPEDFRVPIYILKQILLFHFRQSSSSPVPAHREDQNQLPSTNFPSTPFPSNGISSFEWPTGVTISTSTVSTIHVKKVDDEMLASTGAGDQIVSSEDDNDKNTQKETIIQLVPDQVRQSVEINSM